MCFNGYNDNRNNAIPFRLLALFSTWINDTNPHTIKSYDPTPISKPIQGLRILTDAFTCKACNLTGMSRDYIKRHTAKHNP